MCAITGNVETYNPATHRVEQRAATEFAGDPVKVESRQLDDILSNLARTNAEVSVLGSIPEHAKPAWLKVFERDPEYKEKLQAASYMTGLLPQLREAEKDGDLVRAAQLLGSYDAVSRWAENALSGDEADYMERLRRRLDKAGVEIIPSPVNKPFTGDTPELRAASAFHDDALFPGETIVAACTAAGVRRRVIGMDPVVTPAEVTAASHTVRNTELKYNGRTFTPARVTVDREHCTVRIFTYDEPISGDSRQLGRELFPDLPDRKVYETEISIRAYDRMLRDAGWEYTFDEESGRRIWMRPEAEKEVADAIEKESRNPENKPSEPGEPQQPRQSDRTEQPVAEVPAEPNRDSQPARETSDISETPAESDIRPAGSQQPQPSQPTSETPQKPAAPPAPIELRPEDSVFIGGQEVPIMFINPDGSVEALSVLPVNEKSVEDNGRYYTTFPSREALENAADHRPDGSLRVIRDGKELLPESVQSPVPGQETSKAERPTQVPQEPGKYDRTVPQTREAQKTAISRVIDFARKVKDKIQRAVIAGITKRQSEDFAELGLDIDETWVHSFESSAYGHNQKHHGNSENEARRGQIAITEDDYARIPEILDSYDRVSKSTNKTKGVGNEVIIYEKEFDDGYIYYLEEKRDRRKSLAFHTMYKKKKGTDSSDGFAVESTAPITPVAPSDNLDSSSDRKVNTKSTDTQIQAEKTAGNTSETPRLQEHPEAEPTDPKGLRDGADRAHRDIDALEKQIESHRAKEPSRLSAGTSYEEKHAKWQQRMDELQDQLPPLRELVLKWRAKADRLEQEQTEAEERRVIAEGGIPEDADGNWQFHKVTPEHTYRFLTERQGYASDDVIATADANIDAKEPKKPKLGANAKANAEKLQDYNRRLEEFNRNRDYWQQVKDIAVRDKAEAEKAAEAARAEEIRRQEEERRRAEEEAARRGAEKGVGPEIIDRWNGAEKIQGRDDAIITPSGRTIRGRYILVEEGAATPSHDPETGFAKSPGFPVDKNGNTVNDRDYERDHAAQQYVHRVAAGYDGRAVQDPVIVSRDGVVLSGNNRTMSGRIAARDNTDAGYIGHLEATAAKYGFTAEQVRSMKHPRLYFETEENLPYTAETFALFNKTEKKEMNVTERSVKLGKTISEGVFNRMAREMDAYETFAEYARSPEAVQAIKDLHAAGVIETAELPRYYDEQTGAITPEGVSLLQGALIGHVFSENPDVVRMAMEHPAVRDSILKALVALAENSRFSPEYSLIGDISRAIEIYHKGKEAGFRTVSESVLQHTLLEEPDIPETTALVIADLLNGGKTTRLQKFLKEYNADARLADAGQLDIFSENAEPKPAEEILRQVYETLGINPGQYERYEKLRNNGKPDEPTGPEGPNGPGDNGPEGSGGNAPEPNGPQGGKPGGGGEPPQTPARPAGGAPQPGGSQPGDSADPRITLRQRDGETSYQISRHDVLEAAGRPRGMFDVAKTASHWHFGGLYDSDGRGSFLFPDRERAEAFLKAAEQYPGDPQAFEKAARELAERRDDGLFHKGEKYTVGEEKTTLEILSPRSLRGDYEVSVEGHKGIFKESQLQKILKPETLPEPPDTETASAPESPNRAPLDSPAPLGSREQPETPSGDLPFDRGNRYDRDTRTDAERRTDAQVYDAGKALLESAGIKVHEVSDPQASAMLDNNSSDARLMGSRTDAKMKAIGAHYAGRQLDPNTQAVVDVFSGKRDNVAIEITRPDGKRRIVMRQGREPKAGTKHSLYRHFETSTNNVTVGEIAQIPEVIAKGERTVNGKKVAYDYTSEDGVRLRVTTEIKNNGKEEFTNFLSNRKPRSPEYRRPLKGDTQSSAQTSDAEVSDAKVTQNPETTKYSIGTYHGSHADFDAFSHDHVGEGEGNQAFGWGSYVSESESVGRYYAKGISRRNGEQRLSVDGREVDCDGFTNPWRLVRDLFIDCNGRLREMRRRAGRYAEFAEEDSPMHDVWPRVVEILKNRKRGDIKLLKPQAHLYTVEIPDDTGNNYLDWESTIPKEMLDKIKAALAKRGVNNEMLEEMDGGSGRATYRTVSRYCGSDKAASELLSSLGITGIRYLTESLSGGNRTGEHNYVIFNDADLKITGHARFLRDGQGIVYGWTSGGEVFLNRDAMNPETPLHEYTHLWDTMVQRENPALWSRGKELLRQTALWRQVIEDDAYADIRDNEDAVASEVHSRLTGQDGQRLLRSMIEDARSRGSFETAKATTLVDSLRSWMRRMFGSLKQTLSRWSGRDLSSLTLDDFNRLTLRDLAEGINPQRETARSRQASEVNETNRMRDDYHTGIRSREDVRSFDEVLAEAEKDFAEDGAMVYPDMDIETMRQAKNKGTITVYSSKPIEAGTFVTPSRMNASDYAGEGRIYEKEIPVDSVAWISIDEGQYTPASAESEKQAWNDLRFHAAMTSNAREFRDLQERAVREKGIVMPGLADKEVTIVDVPRHPFTGEKPISQARRWAKGNIVGEHTLIDSSNREVPYTISGKAIEKYLSETAIGKSANMGVHLAVLTRLPEVISESIEAEVHPDYSKNNNAKRTSENEINGDSLIHRFYGAVEVDGETFRVKTTIIENGVAQKNKPHSYEVTAVELIEDAVPQPDNHGRIGRPRFSETQHIVEDESSSGGSISAAKLLKGVEKSYDSGKFLLEESEKAENPADIRFRDSGQLTREYGPRWLSEQQQEDGRHSTQVANTIHSYQKFGDWVRRDSQGREVSVLDASSGLGLGTRHLNEMGITTEDVEPYPSAERPAPTFRSYADVDKQYDYIISNAVLNVLPEDWRRDVLRNMAVRLKPGGKMLINVRGAKGIISQGKEGQTRLTLDDPSEILVLRPDGSIRAYQKGFTKAELKGWVQKELGDGYEVEIANKENAGSTYDTAVLVRRKTADETQGEQRFREQESAHSSRRDSGTVPTPREARAAVPVLDLAVRDTRARLDAAGNPAERQAIEQELDQLLEEQDAYATGRAPQTPEQRANVRRAAETTAAALGEKVVIHTTAAGITHPDAAVRARMRRAKGWYDAATGEVHINAFNHATEADVARTMLHESIGHKALRDFYGDRFDSFLDEIYTSAEESIRRQIAAGMGRNGWNVREATEEYMATLAETVDRHGAEHLDTAARRTWQRTKTAVKRTLNRILEKAGLTARVGLTDRDLSYLLWRQYRSRRKAGALEAAENQTRLEALRRDPESFAPEKTYGYEKTPVAGQPNRANEKLTSGSILLSAKGDSSSNANVPSEVSAKVTNNTQSAKNNIRKFINGDAKMDLSSVNNAFKSIGSLFSMRSNGGSRYTILRADNGDTIALRLSDHAANGRNFGRDNADRNVSIVIERRKFNTPESDIAFTEVTIPVETFNRRPSETVRAIVEGVDGLLRGEEFSLDPSLGTVEKKGNASGATYRFRDGEEDTPDPAADPQDARSRRIFDLMVDMCNRNKDNVEYRDAARKTLTGRLATVARGMRLQRDFDRAQLAAVTDTCNKMIGLEILDTDSRTDMARTIKTINGSAGKEDLEDTAYRLLGIASHSQVRMARRRLDDLSRIRGTKTGDDRIQRQAGLDPEGQATAKAFRDFRKLPEQNIQTAMARVSERIAGDDVPESASMLAAAEMLGLRQALLHSQEDALHRDNLAGIEDALRDLKNQWDPSLSGEERRRYRQAKKSLGQQRIVEELRHADALGAIADSMGDTLQASKERVRIFREAEKERVNNIHHDANCDMQGRPAHADRPARSKLVNNTVTSFFLAPTMTFDQMLRMFGKHSANGEGYLYYRFMSGPQGWQACEDRRFKSKQAKERILDRKAAEILGKDKAHWADLYNLTRAEGCTLTYNSAGVEVERKVSQGNLMYIYMANKMTDGAVKLRHMNITEEDMDLVEEVLDPRLRQLADWIQDDFLPSTRDGYNEVHMRMFGAPMDYVENYFPLKITEGEIQKNVEIGEMMDDGQGDTPKILTGAIRKRVFNTRALNVLDSDPVAITLDHLEEMEDWAAFSEFRRDLGTLLSYRRFKNQVKNTTSVYGAGEKLWKRFGEVAQLTGGADQGMRSGMAGEVDKAVVNLCKLGTASRITYRVFTALKQFTSLPAFGSDTNLWNAIHSTATPRASWQWCMENMPSFEKRWVTRQAGIKRFQR